MKIGDLAEHYTEPRCWGLLWGWKPLNTKSIGWMEIVHGSQNDSMVKKCP